MANETLEEILNVSAAAGPFGSGDAVLEQTLRDFIQLQSNTIAIGTSLVASRQVGWTTFKWYTGVEGTFTYPLDDNAVTDPTKVGNSSYSVVLNKGQGRCVFLDSVYLRGESWENLDRQQLAIIRNRADTIDNHILSTLLNAAGQTTAVGAGSEWDTASENAEGNILTAMDLLFANAKVSGNEGLALVVPAAHRSVLLNTTLYGNVVQSLEEHLKGIAGITVFYTRDALFADTALLLVPGGETAEFFEYNGPGFMETELTRLPGVGFDWMLTSYFGTVIHEHQDGATAGNSNRIVSITNITA